MKKSTLLTFLLTFLSLVMISVGIFSGGAESVWQKAITICLECIGIG